MKTIDGLERLKRLSPERRAQLLKAIMDEKSSSERTSRIPRRPQPDAAPLSFAKSAFSTDEPQTPKADVTSYNNFYEFGTGKEDPASYAGSLTTSPWSIKIDGLASKPATYTLEEISSP